MPDFDILAEAVVDTADCELNKANGEPMRNATGDRCSITLYGPSTDQFAQMQARQRKRMRERIGRGKGEVATETENREKAEDLASITKSLNHFTFPGEFKRDGDMFSALYLERKLGFVFDQANSFVSDWGNFSPDSKVA